jgi:glutaredoxin
LAFSDSEIIFFYGDLCPHCKVVEKYFDENKVTEKIQFSQREIYRDEANSALMIEKAKKCGLDEKTLGVPFLWAEGKCLLGDEDVIKYFENKLN